MSKIAHPFNAAKLLWHREKIELFRSGAFTKGPVSLEWDLSNVCPHDCGFCSFGTSESHGYRQQNWQSFPFDRAMSIIPELIECGVESVTLTGGGEPTIHPKFVAIAAALTPLQWGLVTNGQLLTDARAEVVAEGAKFVRVSLDSGTQETHGKMHRPKKPCFDDIIDNIRAMASRTTHPTIGASFCVTDTNFHEIGICAAKLKDAGANYLEVRPTYPTTWRGDGWDFALSNVTSAINALSDARASHENGTFKIIGMIERFDSLSNYSKGYSKCQIGPLTSVLGADGRLWHCCVQRGMDGFCIGNVLDGPFADVWASAQAKRMADVIDVKQCPRCRYDGYNALVQGLDTDAMHLAFV